MRSVRLFFTVWLVGGLLLPVAARGQGFEGAVTMRNLSVSESGLSLLRDAGLDLGEDARYGVEPTKLFAVPISRLLELDRGVEVSDYTFYVKGTQFRAAGEDDSGPMSGGYMLMDLDQGIFRMVQPAGGFYVEWTKDEIAALTEDERPSADEAGDGPQIRALGASRTINGMNCQAYEIESADELSVAWVTDQLKDLVQSFRAFESTLREMNLYDEEEGGDGVMELMVRYGFPMLVQTLHPRDDGSVADYDIQEVVNVERKPLADDLFAVDPRLRKMTMQELMQEMFQAEPND